MIRVLFLTNIPSPYQVDFFSELAGQPGLDVHVLFAASSESDRQFTLDEIDTFNARILNSVTMELLAKDAHYVRGFSAVLKQYRDVDLAVISGSYFMPAALQFRAWAERRKIPWLYWGENPRKKGVARDRPWKELYLRLFLRNSAGVFGVGCQACSVYRDILGSDKKIFNLPYAPNLQPIIEPSEEIKSIAAKLRDGWSEADPIVILFSGSLSERKAPDMLLEAFIALKDKQLNARLLFAGDGPLRKGLEARAKQVGVESRVRFLGFVEGDALRAAYLSADIFVLPTRGHEGWGVVVQEALAAGLPVLASDSVGAGHDLISDEAGLVFASGGQENLIVSLEALIQNSGNSNAVVAREKRARAAYSTGCQRAASRFGMYLEELSERWKT